MKRQVAPLAIARSRALRRNPTEAEKAMWRLLKSSFPEARFRRQVPLTAYIADFASHRLRLVIEVDGGQHDADVDRRRTKSIESEGYRVVRFWNNEVLGSPDACRAQLSRIIAGLHPHPAATRRRLRGTKSSHPSPIEGEEEQVR